MYLVDTRKEERVKGYVKNIEQETLKNKNFRKVLFTAKHSQLVVMSLKPGEEIGAETHALDQFIRFESGKGVVMLGRAKHRVRDDIAVVIPADTRHNVINTSRKKR